MHQWQQEREQQCPHQIVANHSKAGLAPHQQPICGKKQDCAHRGQNQVSHGMSSYLELVLASFLTALFCWVDFRFSSIMRLRVSKSSSLTLSPLMKKETNEE